MIGPKRKITWGDDEKVMIRNWTDREEGKGDHRAGRVWKIGVRHWRARGKHIREEKRGRQVT